MATAKNRPDRAGGNARGAAPAPDSVAEGSPDSATPGWILLGVIGRPRGVRGALWVRSHTADPASIAAYGPLTDRKTGRRFTLTVDSVGKGKVAVRIAGIEDRDAAGALAGTELWVPRDRLPAPDPEEFYHADLVGLEALGPKGERLGRVAGVYASAGIDVLDIACPDGRIVAVPFTRACVPEVDVSRGLVRLDPPEELFGGEALAGSGEKSGPMRGEA